MNRALPVCVVVLCVVSASQSAPVMAQCPGSCPADLPACFGSTIYDPVALAGVVAVASGGRAGLLVPSATAIGVGLVEPGAVGPLSQGQDNVDAVGCPWLVEIKCINLGTATYSFTLEVGFPGIEGAKPLCFDVLALAPGGCAYLVQRVDDSLFWGGVDVSSTPFAVVVEPPTASGGCLSIDAGISEGVIGTPLRYPPVGPSDLPRNDDSPLLTWGFTLAPIGASQGDLGGSARLFLDNLSPTIVDYADHRVPVTVGTTFQVKVVGPTPGLPLILVAATDYTPSALSVPWGGSLDFPFAGAQLLADGFTPSLLQPFFVTGLAFDLFASPTLVGSEGPTLQGIYQDQTNPPFFLENTQAGTVDFVDEVVTRYHALGDDDAVEHQLAPGVSVLFGGQPRTSLFLGSNGQVTFGEGGSLASTTTGTFFNGFRPVAGQPDPNPGVAFWGDFNPSTLLGAEIVVRENLMTGVVSVSYLDQVWTTSLLSAGSWTYTFGGPVVQLDLTAALPGQPMVDPPLIVGVTDGLSAGMGPQQLVPDYTQDVPILTGPGFSVAEHFPGGGGSLGDPFDLTLLTFTDLSVYEWSIQ